MSCTDFILETADYLPPAPQILLRLLKELESADVDVSRIVDLIAFDPALTAKLLQTCNSAAYFPARRVDQVAEAVHRLGFHIVYTIVAAVVSQQFLRPIKQLDGIDAGRLWKHSVTTAFACQFVAEDLGLDAGMLFTAGLLHDLGKVVLAQVFKKDYARLLQARPAWGAGLLGRERATFGVEHAEIGAQIMERWKFSAALAESVRFHHDPETGGGQAHGAACVSLGDALAHSLEANEATAVAGENDDTLAALRGLGLPREAFLRCRGRVQENRRFVETLCALA